MLSAMGVLTFLRCCPPPAGRSQKVVLIWILQSITRMQSKCLWNIYTSAYMPPVNWGFEAQSVLHSRVYVLAEHLCMDSLKNEAFKQLAAILVGKQKSTGRFGRDSWTYSRAVRFSSATILNMIEIVYKGTPLPRTITDETISNGISAEGASTENSLSRVIWKEESPSQESPLGSLADEASIDPPAD
jgi:hypothetical protein